MEKTIIGATGMLHGHKTQTKTQKNIMNNNHSYSILYNKIGSEPRFHTQKNVCVNAVMFNSFNIENIAYGSSF